MSNRRPSIGDTVCVKEDGPFHNQEGVVIGVHGNSIRVEFGDGRYFQEEQPKKPWAIPIRGGRVRGDNPRGESIRHVIAASNLWIVKERDDGFDD